MKSLKFGFGRLGIVFGVEQKIVVTYSEWCSLAVAIIVPFLFLKSLKNVFNCTCELFVDVVNEYCLFAQSAWIGMVNFKSRAL